MHANIISTGSYVPEIKVTNDDLRARFVALSGVAKEERQALLAKWKDESLSANELATLVRKSVVAKSARSGRPRDSPSGC